MADRVCQFLSGSTVAADFDADNDYYFINESGRRWQPNVARRRRGQMGNRPRFEDVDEEIPISITGSSVSAIVGRETALVNLIDQAQRKFDGEGVDAVTWKYRLQDSTLTDPLQVMIVGYPSSGPVLVYDGEYEETGLTSTPYKRDMVFRFARRGEWLDAEDSGSTSSSTANPGVMTATNTATAPLSPFRIQMNNFKPIRNSPSYLIFSDEDLDAPVTASTATITGYTAVNDSANLPFHGTNILRYTAASTGFSVSGGIDLTSMMHPDTQDIGIFANVRAPDETEGLIGGWIIAGMGTGQEILTMRPQPVANSTGARDAPEWKFLGTVRTRAPIQYLTSCDFLLSTKTTGIGQTVDIDALWFCDMKKVQIIGLPPSGIHSGLTTLVVNHRLDSGPFPLVHAVDGAADVQTTANGDLMLVAQNAAVNAIWLSNGVGSNPNHKRWCAVDPSAGTRLSNVLLAVRRPAYLVPQ